jgi:hypothetical protein
VLVPSMPRRPDRAEQIETHPDAVLTVAGTCGSWCQDKQRSFPVAQRRRRLPEDAQSLWGLPLSAEVGTSPQKG